MGYSATEGVRSEEADASISGRSGDGRTRRRRRSSSGMGAALTALAARAVVGTDGEVWTANSAFCSLVGLDEPALRHLGWRQLVHPADRQYVAAHLVEVLAGNADLREFDLRLVPPHGRGRAGPHARGVGARQRRPPGLVPRGGLGNYVGSRPRWTWSTQRRTPPDSSFRRSWCASRSRRSSMPTASARAAWRPSASARATRTSPSS